MGRRVDGTLFIPGAMLPGGNPCPVQCESKRNRFAIGAQHRRIGLRQITSQATAIVAFGQPVLLLLLQLRDHNLRPVLGAVRLLLGKPGRPKVALLLQRFEVYF